jgi:hypothetical protein
VVVQVVKFFVGGLIQMRVFSIKARTWLLVESTSMLFGLVKIED